ncbi:MAG TPA: integrase core domain-containing protein, partial [Chloroflexota bacterium]|nr:integrase core domain-containing protein [Chloroflexota bacterium]
EPRGRMGALKQPSLSRRLSMAQCISLGVVCAAEAPMRLVSALNRPALRLASQPPPTLSRQAKQRLKWFDWHASHGRNVSLTCRYFGISRQTFYRWQRRYNPQRIQTLEDRLSRPHQRRQPTWTLPQRQAVHALREQYPRWGKDKLKVLLDRQRLVLSVSMVGRILSHLKRSGQLVEPVGRISARKRRWQRPYAVRKPRDYAVAAPGDLVQIDTLDVRPRPGVILKHFTARDVVSRWDVLELASRATALTATRALEAVLERMPFPVSAIQVDGGSEFMADFEAACAARGIRLFELPPRSPKLNGAVERAQRTHTEEFYECSFAPPTVAELGAELRTWEVVYNTVRPHQALGYLTPLEFVTAWNQHHAREEECNGGTERVHILDQSKPASIYFRVERCPLT